MTHEHPVRNVQPIPPKQSCLGSVSQPTKDQNDLRSPNSSDPTTFYESRFQYNFSHIPVGTHHQPIIQSKLKIGQVGDRYEQEADRVAAQVVNQMSISQPARGTQSVQRKEIDPEEEENLQMKPAQPQVQLRSIPNPSSETSVLETEIGRSRGTGQPLAKQVRTPMEQAFGADFSRVKVHSNARSDQLNRSIQAHAFTTGQDIFFRQGFYQPNTHAGRELLAHELTHVIQQCGNGSSNQLGTSPVQPGIIQRKFGFEIELNMLLTSERQIDEGGVPKTVMGEPLYIKQPVTAKGNGFTVHADHHMGKDSSTQNKDSAIAEPELHFKNAPIVELVTDAMDEFSMTETDVATVMQRLVTFANTAAANTNNFTQRTPVNGMPGITSNPTNLYIGSQRKKLLNPLQGQLQMTQGIRLTKLPQFFQEYTANTKQGITPLNANIKLAITQAELVAGQIIDELWNNYKDAERKSDGTKRFFKNTFVAPANKADMDELKGLLFLMANYLIVGNLNTGSFGWGKNLFGAVFYKSKLSSVANSLTGFNRTILQKRPQKIAKLLLQHTGRNKSQPVLYLVKKTGQGEDTEKTLQSRESCNDWILNVLGGKNDSIFEQFKNQYAGEIAPEPIGPGGHESTAVIMENRKLSSLLGNATSAPNTWVQVAKDVYNLVKGINT